MMMKNIFSILLILLLFASCKEDDDYFYKGTPETVNQNMWDVLQSEPTFDYYTGLIKQFGLDTMFSHNGSYTLFIPTEDALNAIDTSVFKLRNILLYQMISTQVNLQSIDASMQVKTLLKKYALIEHDKVEGGYIIDGIRVSAASSLFNNGCYYMLAGCVTPPPNIYEYFQANSAAFKNYVDYTDSLYFDIEASTPIAITEEGTIYDSLFYTINWFSEMVFPVKEETRDNFATFTIFTDDQYKNAIDIMKSDLNIDEVPNAWLNDIFMPRFLSKSIFVKSLQYDDFNPRMVNVIGDSVDVDVANINEDSRYVCSNGVVYFLNDFIIADSLYKSNDPIYASEMVEEVVRNEKWTWSEIVETEGLTGTGIEPKIQNSNFGLDGSLLVLEFDKNIHETRNIRITFTKEGVFGAERFRLVWGGTSAYCGLWNIYINGEPVQMRTYAGKDAEHFDSYMFSSTTIKSVTGLSNFKRQGNNYNTADFTVETLTEYSDVEITFEYVGPSLNFSGNIQGTPGIVIDYLLLEIY